MKLRTELNPKSSLFKIVYSHKIMTFGSCFSVEMAQKLDHLKYRVFSNPSGITFNPISISNTIMSTISGDSLPEEELIHNGNLWCHHDFHSSFNHSDKTKALDTINASISEAHSFSKECSVLIITLGTAFVYEHAEKGRIVNNCHKIPQSNFNRRLLSIDEITEDLGDSLRKFEDHCANELQVICTVSPVRHIKDGLHENQISKARCLLALDELCKGRDNYHYFPSYEILLDDLRDYRFYAEDMIHPSAQAVDYIFNKFEEAFLHPGDSDLRKKISRIQAALAHKAFNPESEQHKAFIHNLKEEIVNLKSEYPFLDF